MENKVADYKKLASDAQALAEQATSGPWKEHKEPSHFYTSQIWSEHKHAWDEEDEEYNVICRFPTTHEYGYGSDSHVEKDSTFIAASRTLVPDLAEAVLRLTAALELALYYVDGDSAHEICKAKVERILEGEK